MRKRWKILKYYYLKLLINELKHNNKKIKYIRSLKHYKVSI